MQENDDTCESLTRVRGENGRQMADLISRRDALEARRVELERLRRDVSERQMRLERETFRLENRLEAARKAQDTVTASLWDEYELTRATAAQTAAIPQNIPDAQARVNELRRQIRGLGSVYTGAIEEHAALSERYAFLKEQRDDAEASKKQLIGVISDLQKKMREQFLEQFSKINDAFNITFNEIFGGGSARLTLEDTANVLECGIEIHVQLPGKSLKVLSLLSGGERAFVAIALYFAILRVRPSPFCILDEIDAALDDSNVARFARYLRKFTDTTQFIVITHRRQTMEEADMLYGVAMPVRGVSRLLAFNVQEAADALGL